MSKISLGNFVKGWKNTKGTFTTLFNSKRQMCSRIVCGFGCYLGQLLGGFQDVLKKTAVLLGVATATVLVVSTNALRLACTNFNNRDSSITAFLSPCPVCIKLFQTATNDENEGPSARSTSHWVLPSGTKEQAIDSDQFTSKQKIFHKDTEKIAVAKTGIKDVNDGKLKTEPIDEDNIKYDNNSKDKVETISKGKTPINKGQLKLKVMSKGKLNIEDDIKEKTNIKDIRKSTTKASNIYKDVKIENISNEKFEGANEKNMPISEKQIKKENVSKTKMNIEDNSERKKYIVDSTKGKLKASNSEEDEFEIENISNQELMRVNKETIKIGDDSKDNINIEVTIKITNKDNTKNSGVGRRGTNNDVIGRKETNDDDVSEKGVKIKGIIKEKTKNDDSSIEKATTASDSEARITTDVMPKNYDSSKAMLRNDDTSKRRINNDDVSNRKTNIEDISQIKPINQGKSKNVDDISKGKTIAEKIREDGLKNDVIHKIGESSDDISKAGTTNDDDSKRKTIGDKISVGRMLNGIINKIKSKHNIPIEKNSEKGINIDIIGEKMSESKYHDKSPTGIKLKVSSHEKDKVDKTRKEKVLTQPISKGQINIEKLRERETNVKDSSSSQIETNQGKEITPRFHEDIIEKPSKENIPTGPISKGQVNTEELRERKTSVKDSNSLHTLIDDAATCQGKCLGIRFHEGKIEKPSKENIPTGPISKGQINVEELRERKTNVKDSNSLHTLIDDAATCHEKCSGVRFHESPPLSKSESCCRDITLPENIYEKYCELRNRKLNSSCCSLCCRDSNES